MTAETAPTLADRVLQFQLMELPGQPMMMHMGTSYLVSDLWSAHKEMAEALRGLLAANDAVELALCDSPEVPGYDPKELGRAQKRVTEAEKVARAVLKKAGG